MANRFLQQFMHSFEHKPVKIFGSILVGGSGAVTSFTGNGVTSVTKESGAGTYTILLNDAYSAFLGVNVVHEVATAEELVIQLISHNVAAASKTVVIGCSTSGTLANPASGTILYFEITLRNSSVTR